MAKTKIAVLISGRGTNLQSLLDACSDDAFPADIALVISNRPGAAGLARAQKAGVATLVLDHKAFGTKEQKYDDGRAEFENALSDALTGANVDYVCLAGFMRILTADFVNKWRGRIMNIHPSLLPAFKGLNVHERMIAAGVKIGGCTVHFVTSEMDAGPIIGQAAVPVLPGDDADTLAARILEQEHKLYPECVKLIATGKARLTTGNIVKLDDDVCPETVLMNPKRSG